MPLSRRDVLRAAPLAAVPLVAPAARAGQPPADEAVRFPGLIVRSHEPRNWETPLTGAATGGAADGTPWAGRPLYVRNHFARPGIDLKGYRLRVEGLVENPLELTLDDLRKMPAVSRLLTLECAGNSRVFLTPPARGLQWGNGAVGFKTWTGTPLGAVLERAKVKAGAAEVVLVGADRGQVTADPPSPGPIHFNRSLPLAKAKKDETVLAWGMEDAPLAPDHGAPVRAVVGGWYGMASVKWLTRIVVTDKPHDGYWQTIDYAVWDRTGVSPRLVPVTTIHPKAILTTLTDGAEVRAGKKVRVGGVAWAGEDAVGKVEFSPDGGATWGPTTLAPNPEPFRPVVWRADWTAPAARGVVRLAVRCTDAKGRTQPPERDPDRRSYMINHVVPVEVTVV